MKTKTHIKSRILAASSAACLIGIASAQDTLTSDDFEGGGTGSFGSWINNGSDAGLYQNGDVVSNMGASDATINYAPNGDFCLWDGRGGSNLVLANPLPLGSKGYTSVTISFNYNCRNGSGTRRLYTAYSPDDGASWQDLGFVTGSGSTSYTISAGSYSLTDSAKFRFAFGDSGGAAGPFFVDDVVIEASPTFTGTYWDSDGATPGAGGANPTGTWGTDNFWSASPDGDAATGAWSPGANAVFSAGSDATGAFTVTVDATQDISGIVFEEGTVNVSGGTALRMVSDTTIAAGSGVTATLATDLIDDGTAWNLTKSGGGTLVLSGDNSAATGDTFLNESFTEVASLNSFTGSGENVTLGSAGILVFGSTFPVGDVSTALDRLVPTSTGTVAVDSNTDTADFDFSTAGLTDVYFAPIGSVNYTGTLTAGGSAYNLGGLGGTLTLNSALTSGNALNVRGPGTIQFNGFDSPTGAFSISGTPALENGSATADMTLTLNPSSDLSYTAPIRDGGAASLKLVKAGSKELYLLSDNDFSGGFDIEGGRVQASGSSSPNAFGDSGNTVTFTGNAALANTKTGTFTMVQGLHINSGVTGTLSVTFGESLNIDGVVSGDGTMELSGGSANGNLRLRNPANTHTGTLDVKMGGGNAWRLYLESIADSTNPIQLGSGTQDIEVYFTNDSPIVLNDRPLELRASSTNGETRISATGTQPVSFNAGITGTTAGTKRLILRGNNGGDNTAGGDITDGSGVVEIVKDETGKWVLNGDSSYTGSTTVLRGTLGINSIADYGANSAIGAPASGDIALGRNDGYDGTLLYTGSGHSSNRTITIGTDVSTTYNGSALIINDGSGPLTFTASAFNTPIPTIADDRTLTLGGSYTGGVNEVQGVIADNDAGTTGYVGLIKTGDSIWALAGANTYTNATTINGGTLLINGSTAASSAVAVNGTAILGGTGTVGGSVTVAAGAGVAPGASAGTLTIGGDLDISAVAGLEGGTLAFELGSSSDTIGADTLNIGTDALRFSDFNFSDIGGLADGTYVLVSTTSGITGSLDTTPANLTGAVGAGTGTLGINGNNLELVVTGIGGGSPFDTWAARDGASGVTFGGDVNNDGVTDGLAFLLGADNPNVNANGLLPTATETGGDLVMAFVCLADAARGASVLDLQWDGDLAAPWSSVAVPGTPGTTGPTDGTGTVNFVATAGGTNGEGDALINIVATIDDDTEAAAGKLFGRLEATE